MSDSMFPNDVVLSFSTKHLLNPTETVFIKAPQLCMKPSQPQTFSTQSSLCSGRRGCPGALPPYQSTQTNWRKEALSWTTLQPCASRDALEIQSNTRMCRGSWSFGDLFSSFWCKTGERRLSFILPKKSFYSPGQAGLFFLWIPHVILEPVFFFFFIQIRLK